MNKEITTLAELSANNQSPVQFEANSEQNDMNIKEAERLNERIKSRKRLSETDIQQQVSELAALSLIYSNPEAF